jgi:hypothetical protein
LLINIGNTAKLMKREYLKEKAKIKKSSPYFSVLLGEE